MTLFLDWVEPTGESISNVMSSDRLMLKARAEMKKEIKMIERIA
jgi:hypothetical protein